MTDDKGYGREWLGKRVDALQAAMTLWELTLRDPDDPYGHTARARQTALREWTVEYHRGEEVVGDGLIGTPRPHDPPYPTIIGELLAMRKAADYWAARGCGPDGDPLTDTEEEA